MSKKCFTFALQNKNDAKIIKTNKIPSIMKATQAQIADAKRMTREASEVKDYLLRTKTDRFLKRFAQYLTKEDVALVDTTEYSLRETYKPFAKNGGFLTSFLSDDCHQEKTFGIHARTEFIPTLGGKSRKVVRLSFVAI